jgi:hypothetical protein
MPAIMDPVMPEIDEPRAETFESETENPVVPEDSIPLESMTWPELKRVAREYDLKLNVKKSVLIRQIRDARSALVENFVHRQSFRGRMEGVADEVRQRLNHVVESFVAWWKSDAAPSSESTLDASGADGMSRIKKIAIWGGGIAAGAVVATIAALL